MRKRKGEPVSPSYPLMSVLFEKSPCVHFFHSQHHVAHLRVGPRHDSGQIAVHHLRILLRPKGIRRELQRMVLRTYNTRIHKKDVERQTDRERRKGRAEKEKKKKIILTSRCSLL